MGFTDILKVHYMLEWLSVLCKIHPPNIQIPNYETKWILPKREMLEATNKPGQVNYSLLV